MGCERYEIGVKATQSSMMQRTCSASEFEHGIAWLKRVNAQDHDIYIRPEGSVGLVLIDDLGAAALAQLRDDGLAPAVVVKTSPGNYQAWLRLSLEPIAPEHATATARILAERYGGDPNSADFRHFGRLAGFTNRKPKHRHANGMQVQLVHEAHGTVTQRGAELLHEAEARLIAAAEAQPAATRMTQVSPPPDGLRTPGEAYAYYARWILARYPNTDYSRVDWMVCCDIASASLAADEQYLEQVLRDGSPHLAERKVGHVEEYVARTAHKVIHDPKVTAARERLAHSTSQAPGEARREL